MRGNRVGSNRIGDDGKENRGSRMSRYEARQRWQDKLMGTEEAAGYWTGRKEET